MGPDREQNGDASDPEGTIAVRDRAIPPKVKAAAFRAAPWALSVMVHLGIAGVLTCMFFLIADGREDDVIVPDARLSSTPGRRLQASHESAPLEMPAPAAPAADLSAPIEPAEAALIGEPAPVDADLLGLEEASVAGPRLLDPAALGGQVEPVSRFYGDGGNVHHVVYVVDCSGSMYGALGTPRSPGPVRMEMLRSIGDLTAEQSFHIIFFAAGAPRECPPGRLVPATDENKLQAARFIKTIRPDVRTDPLPALRRAFEVLAEADRSRPGRLIYLLTDGQDFPDAEGLMGALERLNRDRRVHINTILYDHRPGVDVRRSPLQRIASTHGGWFKRVVDNE